MPAIDPPSFTSAELEVLAGADTSDWPRLTFYLAGPYGRREELLEYREDLVSRGHRAPCRWLRGDHQVQGAAANQAIEAGGSPPAEISRSFATDDLEDIERADVVVSFTEPPGGAPRGGRHVEFGYALARTMVDNRFVLVVIGHIENIFHALEDVYFFETWDEFLVLLDSWVGRT